MVSLGRGSSRFVKETSMDAATAVVFFYKKKKIQHFKKGSLMDFFLRKGCYKWNSAVQM